MSRFVGTAAPVYFASIITQDQRIRLPIDQWEIASQWAAIAPWEDGTLWPSPRLVGSDANGLAPFGQDAATTCQWAAPPLEGGGAQRFFMIVGTARDSGGVALGGATIKAYTTADDVERGQTVSQIDGSFRCPTAQTGTHYLVAYKAGSPDVSGTTTNTLTGV